MVLPSDLEGAGGTMGHTFSTALNLWLDFRKRNWTSPGTERNYKLMAEGWATNIGDTPIGDVGPLDVQRIYLARDNGQRSASWLDKERDTLHGFFAWAVGLQLLAKNPVCQASWPRRGRDGPRSKRSRVHVLITAEILEKLLEVLPIHFHRGVIFLFFTGLRVGELLGAQGSWIVQDERDPTSYLLRIPAGKRKTRRGALVVLANGAIKALGSWGDGPLFPELPSASAFRQALRHAGEKIGIEKLGPHQFRRSTATLLLNSGMPLPQVTRQMGWRQPPREVLDLLTDSYYIAMESPKVRSIVDRLR